MRSNIVTTLLLTTSLAAFGQGGSSSTAKIPSEEKSANPTGSILMGQPSSGTARVLVGPSYSSTEITGRGFDTFKTTGEKKNINIDAKLGLSNSIAVGVKADYEDSQMWYSESHDQTKGMSSPEIFAQTRSLLSDKLALVSRVGYTPAIAREENYVRPTKTWEYNHYTGGQSAQLSLGVESTGPMLLGVLGKAQLKDVATTERKTNGANEFNDKHESGGNVYSLSAFGESKFSFGTLGLMAQYDHLTPSQTSSNKWTGSTGPYIDMMIGSLYGEISASKNLNIQPGISYQKLLNTHVTGSYGTTAVDKWESWVFAVSAVVGI